MSQQFPTETATPDRATVLTVAAKAEADIRTTAKYLRGEHVRPLAAMRIERACRELGITPIRP